MPDKIQTDNKLKESKEILLPQFFFIVIYLDSHLNIYEYCYNYSNFSFLFFKKRRVQKYGQKYN